MNALAPQLHQVAPEAAPPAVPAGITGARLVVEALEREGVTHIFGYPGGAIMPVYDALPGSSLTHILVRHEQAAALAADAWGPGRGAKVGSLKHVARQAFRSWFLRSVPMRLAMLGRMAEP